MIKRKSYQENLHDDARQKKKKAGIASKLPPFVMDFLNKNNIKLIPKIHKDFLEQKNINPLHKAVDSIVQSRSPRAIRDCYESIRKIVFNSPSFLQSEYTSLLFPYFVTLVSQLHFLNYQSEVTNFINIFRSDFFQEQKDAIDYMSSNFDKYEHPPFEVEMSQFALHDLTRKFLEYDTVLLPYIFENCIHVHIVPFICQNKKEEIEESETKIDENDIGKDLDDVYEMNPEICQDNMTKTNKEFSDYHLSKFDLEKTNRILDLPNIAHFTIYNHKNTVNTINLSRSAEILAYSQNSTVKLNLLSRSVSFPDGKSQANITFHRNRVLTSTFSPNSCLIASGSIDGDIRVAHTEACRELCHLDYYMTPVFDLSFDSNSFLLSAASNDCSVSTWTMNDNKLIRQFIGHTQPVIKILYGTGGNTLISLSTDAKIRIWDIGTAKTIQQLSTFAISGEVPSALTLNQETATLAFGSVNGTVKLLDLNNSNQVNIGKFDSQITDLKFTNDGTFLIAGTLDGSVHIWDTRNGLFKYENAQTTASTVDTICVTKSDLVVTLGKSIRGT